MTPGARRWANVLGAHTCDVEPWEMIQNASSALRCCYDRHRQCIDKATNQHLKRQMMQLWRCEVGCEQVQGQRRAAQGSAPLVACSGRAVVVEDVPHLGQAHATCGDARQGGHVAIGQVLRRPWAVAQGGDGQG